MESSASNVDSSRIPSQNVGRVAASRLAVARPRRVRGVVEGPSRQDMILCGQVKTSYMSLPTCKSDWIILRRLLALAGPLCVAAAPTAYAPSSLVRQNQLFL
jgi:hypothetical protein